MKERGGEKPKEFTTETLRGVFILSAIRTRHMKEPLPYILSPGRGLFFVSRKEMKVDKNVKKGSSVLFEYFYDSKEKFWWAQNIRPIT